MTATREYEYSVLAPVLYLAFELGNDFWKLGFTIGMGQRPRERNIAAGDLVALKREIRRAKERFGLPETAAVLSCTVLRQHRLRSRAGWVLAATVSGRAGGGEPGGGLLQHRGEPTAASGQDRSHGCGQAAWAADPLPEW